MSARREQIEAHVGPNAEFSLPAAMLLLTSVIAAPSRPFKAEALEDRLQAQHFSQHPESPIYMQSFLCTYILDIKCYTPESDTVNGNKAAFQTCAVQQVASVEGSFYAFMKLSSSVVSVQLAALHCSPV